MLIAKEKRKTNIAEYILYMWQVEDLIRANNFDIDRIEETMITPLSHSEEVKAEIKDWYANLVAMMEKEQIKKTGHLQIMKNMVNDLFEFHSQLVNAHDAQYNHLYNAARANMSEVLQKAGEKIDNEIELCLQTLYGILMMRLQKKEISEQTMQAVSTFTKMLALLSHRFKKYEEGELEL